MLGEHINTHAGKIQEVTVASIEASRQRADFFFQVFSPLFSQMLTHFGVKDIKYYLVGSVAKNTAQAGSDIDIAYQASGKDGLIRQAFSKTLSVLREKGVPFEINLHSPTTSTATIISGMNLRHSQK